MTNISKFRTLRGLAVLGLALPLFCAGITAVKAAPTATPSTPVFGSVDMEKVVAGDTKKDALDKQINDFDSKLESVMKEQEASPMLSETDQRELRTLLEKANPTDQDKARITELQTSSQKDSDELASLQQTQAKTPTTDQTARLNLLSKEQIDGQQILQAMGEAYRAEAQAETDKLDAQLTATLRQAISEVAQQKGITVVFSAQVAPYTTNDITDDVIKHLNK